MNSAQNSQPGGLNLPPPMAGEPLSMQPNDVPGASKEALLPVPEMSPIPSQAAPPMPAFMMPVTTTPADNTTSSVVAQTTQTVAPSVADDADLIEKEWVVRAKQIVEKTRNDPHQQSREVNMLRADYMQKRYNKEIKLSE